MFRKHCVVALPLILALVLGACTGTTEEATPAPVVEDFVPVVSASGEVVPARWATLSFRIGGLVAEVLVQPGDTVQAGDVLARLDTSDLDLAVEQSKSAVDMARPELVTSELALDDLYEDAALAAAQAQAAVARSREQVDDAQRRYNGLLHPDLEFYEKRVEDASKALTVAQQGQELIDIGEALGGVQAARDNLKRFDEILGKINTALQGCLVTASNPCDPDRVVTIDGVPWTLDDAQDAYNDALNAVRQAEIRLDQARSANSTAIRDAEDVLEDAQRNLDWAQRAPNAIDLALAEADLALAEATLADAQARWEANRSGPDPDAVKAAEARRARAEATLLSAEVALAQAQAALARAELVGPFGGTVTAVYVRSNEVLAAGQPVLMIGDLTTLRVETTDLSEVDVARVAVGQPAKITFDALPEVLLLGHVYRIDPMASLGQGSVNFPVIVEFDDRDPAVRWGMTAFVDIEVASDD